MKLLHLDCFSINPEVSILKNNTFFVCVCCLSIIRHKGLCPLPSSVRLRLSSPWILKRGGLESSGQRLISLNGKTRIIKKIRAGKNYTKTIFLTEFIFFFNDLKKYMLKFLVFANIFFQIFDFMIYLIFFSFLAFMVFKFFFRWLN